MRSIIRVGLVLAVASPAAVSLLAHRWMQAGAVPLPEPSPQRGRHLSAPRAAVRQGSDFVGLRRDRGSGRHWPSFRCSEVGALRDFTGPSVRQGRSVSGSLEPIAFGFPGHVSTH
jgi:hypothetical protein